MATRLFCGTGSRDRSMAAVTFVTSRANIVEDTCLGVAVLAWFVHLTTPRSTLSEYISTYLYIYARLAAFDFAFYMVDFTVQPPVGNLCSCHVPSLTVEEMTNPAKHSFLFLPRL